MINKILLDFLKENKLSYFLYFISLSYIPISRVAMPHMYGKLIGSLKPLKINVTLKFLILLILLWIFIQLIHTGSNMLYGRVIPKFNSFTRTRIIDEIINRYQNNYKDLFVGNIITKLIKAPWILEDIFNEIENFIFSNILVIVTSFFYLFYYNKILGVMYLIFMVFIFAICILFSNSCSDHFSKNEKIFDNSHEEIEDMLSNLISVYTSKKNCYEKGRVAYLSKGILKSEQKTNKCVQKYRMIYSFIFVIIFAILNIYSLKIFFEKKINVSTLSAIIIINYSLLNTFMTIYSQTRRFIELKGRLSVLKTFLENMPDLDESEKQSIDNIQNLSITIQNMGFYYVPKKYILKNVSLKINQNEKIAIIGEIGSGKSTLGKLLIKLFDYDEGSIKLNNIELKDIEILSLRKIITYIPQHPKLFNRTLLSNLTYGSNNIKRETVIKLINSIKIKSIRDVLLTNLDKSVGKYGNNLSGGQRQIVWLIRSILQDSKMIILDEPTSSLDEENKLIVMDFIKSLSKNKTLILITHDMKLLKLVNRVIKFDKGKLIEDNNK